MPTPENQAADRLREIQNRFTIRLRENLSLVCDGVQELLETWDGPRALEIAEIAHQTAGSSPTFGYNDQGFYCRLLETILKAILATEQVPGNAALGEIRELHKFLTRSLAGLGTNDRLPLLPNDPRKNPATRAGGQGIFFLSSGDEDSLKFIEQLTFFGFVPEVFATPAELERALAERTPAALIAEIEFTRAPPASLLQIIRWREESPRPVPVIFLSNRDDFEPRLLAVQAGGFAYFQRPLDIQSMNSLLDRLDELTGETENEGLRVLIVEDDSVLGEYYTMILERAGITTRHCEDTPRFIEDVADFRPDLVLMDLYLGGTLGTDLALVLGQHESFRNIPVIFLSGEQNRDLQIQTLEAGADNFLVKPINPGHLVLALRSRARRSRQHQNMVRRDSLTALYNHVQIKEELNRALARQDSCLTVMIDIDHFKSVNDTQGHAAGDQVIRSLARILKARFRDAGSLGRYGGEEFLLVLPDMEADAGLEKIEELREEFSGIQFRGTSGEFQVTFSCGMSTGFETATVAGLLELADQALYRAKASGRNRTVQA